MNIRAFEAMINNAKKGIKSLNDELEATKTKVAAVEATATAAESRLKQAEDDIAELKVK